MVIGVNTALLQATYDSWLLPLQAWTYAARCVGKDGASGAVWVLLKNGALRTASRQNSWTARNSSPYTLTAVAEIPRGHWQHYSNTGSDLWSGEYVRFFLPNTSSRDTGSATHFGIRIDPVGLVAGLPRPIYTEDQILKQNETVDGEQSAPTQPQDAESQQQAVNPPTAPEAQAAGPKGGRRPAWWREPVLAELAGQLYEGDLKPKILADLEKAANDWLGKQGEFPGERTVRNVVTPLWERISKEGKNPTG